VLPKVGALVSSLSRSRFVVPEKLCAIEPRFSGGMSYRAKRWRVSPFFNFARSRVRFNQLVGLTGVGVPIDPGPPDVPGDPTDPDTPDIPDTPDPGPIDDPDVPIDEPGIDPDDTEIEDRDATRTSFGFGSGFSYVLTPRTSAQLSASSQFVRFSASDDDLENTTRLNFSSSVSRAISERNTGSVSLGVSRFLIDSDDDPNATSVRATVGLSRTVSARLSFNTQAGIVYSVREELEGREDLETSTIGATGSVGVSWRNGEQRFGFNLAQSVQPSSGGEITNRLSVGASFSQPITRTQNFGLTTSLSRRTETFGEDEDGASFVARISPSYSLRLDRDWRASVRYNLTVGSSSDDLRFSNSVFLSVSRAFELYR